MATESPSSKFCYDEKIRPKVIKEPSWNKTSVFLGKDAKFFQNHYVPMETQQKNVWDYLQI